MQSTITENEKTMNTNAAQVGNDSIVDWGMDDDGAPNESAKTVAANIIETAKSDLLDESSTKLSQNLVKTVSVDSPSVETKEDETPNTNAGDVSETVNVASATPASDDQKTDDDGEEKASREANEALLKLNEERDQAIRKINERHAAKAFQLQQKSVKISTRRMHAYETLEIMRKVVREKLENPYMGDSEVDTHVIKYFTIGIQ